MALLKLSELMNLSAPNITRIYIGLRQQELGAVYDSFEFKNMHSVHAVPKSRTACTVSRSKCACCPCFPDSMHGIRGMKRLGRDSAAQPAAACAIPGEGVSKHRSLRNLKVPGCFVSCPLCEQAPNGAGNENSPALCAELRCFERKTGFGPATSTLARLRSTN